MSTAAAAGVAAGTRTRRVAGAGVDLAVTEWGPSGEPDPTGRAGAPTVVLVHGYPDTSSTWDEVAERLAGRYHVVAHDVRGAGASSAPASVGDYRLELLVEDLAAVLDATSPGRPVHLVGHDWGSIQGWEAVTTPRLAGRIASFTSVSGPCLEHVARWVRERVRPDRRGLRQLVRQGRSSAYVLFQRSPLAPAFWRRGGARLVAHRLRRTGQWPADRPLATLPDDGARGAALYRANMRAGTALRRTRERRTEVPVQLVVPTGDPFVTPALHDGVERWVAHLWRRDVAGGHWVHRFRPDLVAGWIDELVTHVEGGDEPASLRRHRVGGAVAGEPGRHRTAQPERGAGLEP